MNTFLEFAQYYEPEIDNDKVNHMLWSQTAYPFGGLQIVVKQLRQAIRINRNKLDVCDLCARKYPYHSNGCLNKEETK